MSSKTTSQLTLGFKMDNESLAWDSASVIAHSPSNAQRVFPVPRRRCVFRHVRYLQLLLGTLFLSLTLGCTFFLFPNVFAVARPFFTDFISFQFSVICFNPAISVMMDVSSSSLLFNHSSLTDQIDFAPWTIPMSERRFAFTNLQKSFLLAGTFGACLFLLFPVAYSMQIYGAWRTQLFVGLAVSLATGLIPVAASLSFYALLLARMVNGLAITNLFPVVGAICTGWAPDAERGVFLAVLSGYIQLSVIISMPLTGFLADKFGWPSIFFVHSALGILLSLLWAFFYRDDPVEHFWVGDDELAFIRSGKLSVGSSKCRPPYRRIISSMSIWAIICAVFGNFLIVQFFNTFLPMFLVSALHFSNSQTGLLSALPLILQFFVKWLTGFVTDHLPSVSDIIKVRVCNSTAFCGAALFFLLASFFSPDAFPRWIVVLCLILAIGILGMNSGGFFKSVVLVSAQFSPTVMAGVQFTLCATIFSFSFVIPAMTSQGGHFDEYRRVFWLYSTALAATNLVFFLFGEAIPAKWTQKVGDDDGKR